MVISLPCMFTWSFFYACFCVQISPFYKDTSHMWSQTWKTHFNSFNSFKDPISKYSHILRYWSLGLTTQEFWTTQFYPQKWHSYLWFSCLSTYFMRVILILHGQFVPLVLIPLPWHLVYYVLCNQQCNQGFWDCVMVSWILFAGHRWASHRDWL